MPASPPPPRLSLRSRISLALGGFSAVLTLALCLLFGHLLQQRMQTQAVQALGQTAHSAQLLLGHEVTLQLARIQELANSRLLWSQGLDSNYVLDALHRIQRINPYIVWAGVATPQGKLAASTLPTLRGLDASQRPWFLHAQSGPFIGDVSATPHLQSLLPQRPSHTPLQLLDFSAPIRDSRGRLQGVLAMHSDWDWVRTTFENLVQPSHGAQHLQRSPHDLFLFDHAGRLLYAPPNQLTTSHTLRQSLPLQPQGKQAITQVAYWQDDTQPYLNAMVYLQLPALPSDKGWWVVARVPAQIAWADAQRARWLGVVFGVLSGLLAAWVAWALARHVTRDLKTLANACQQLLHTTETSTDHGAQTNRMPVLHSSREVFHLSNALQHMTQQLLHTQQHMQALVKARTHELQQANEALQRLAYTDPLTQLLNRRGFERQATPLLQLAQRHLRALSLIALDVDHFKRLNDTYGHDVGDSVLQQLAQLLLARLRSSDVLARFGGEEFIILLPDTDTADALRLAQELLTHTEQTNFHPASLVTLSAGVAGLQPTHSEGYSHDSLRRLILRADQALYRAKQQGRNRAVL